MAKLVRINYIPIILLVTIHITSSAKPNPRPVFESINEQERIDDNTRLASSQGILPYGNPLAGNSKQNARIHANNQQAMFNAERMRQHRAQIQRWSKGPQLVDSYMKAYRDSQENHQLALEEQQATLKDNPVTNPTPIRTQNRPGRQRIVQNKRVPNSEIPSRAAQNESMSPIKRVQKQRQELPRRGETKFFQGLEPTKITKADAVIKEVRNRNHRSYGSADYHQHLEPKRYQTVYVSPAPSYEQGVTIKPNGNAGIAQAQVNEPTNLYTVAVPSDTKYAYPNNVNTFKSVQDIHALNSLLKKNPTEQLTEFNALLNDDKTPDDITKGVPVDFYFYLKDPSQHTVTQHNDNLKYTLPQTYANAYAPEPIVKDYTPITEEIDDIEDPNKGPMSFNLQAIPPTMQPDPTTTTKSNNYYKVEVASQTISTGPKHIKEEYYVKQENDPHYESLTYGYQPIYKETDDSKSEMYLHHNAEPTGVQHLLEDGTETSAFGDDNVSIKKGYPYTNVVHYKAFTDIASGKNWHRTKRSELETEPFLIEDANTTTQVTISSNITDTPTSDALIRSNPFNKKRVNDINVFLAPNFPIGEATDYTDDYDYPQIKKRPHNKYESFYEDDDYIYDDFSSPDYDFQNYPPSSYQLESKGSFSKKVRHYRRPNLSNQPQLYGVPPATSYGVPIYGTPTTIFTSPQTYVQPKLELPAINTLGNFPSVLEPVYMLTQSQLKELIGHHNLNIEHLDVYQVSKGNKGNKTPHYPRKYRKRNPFRHVRNNLHKIHKFHG